MNAQEQFLRAVRELYYWQFGTNPTNFTSQLYDLIGNADGWNRSRLAGAFPAEYEAWEAWQRAPDQMAFFREFLELPIP